MNGIGQGTQTGNGTGVDDQTDPHNHLFHHGGGADVNDLLDLFLIGLEAVTEAEDNILLTIHDSIEGHEHSSSTDR